MCYMARNRVLEANFNPVLLFTIFKYSAICRHSDEIKFISNIDINFLFTACSDMNCFKCSSEGTVCDTCKPGYYLHYAECECKH